MKKTIENQEVSSKNQARKLRSTGSLVNYLMGNNATLPEVGKGCTILSWSDRHAYEVLEVSNDKSQCKIQQYLPERTDSLGMSDCQSYKYEKMQGPVLEVVWRKSRKGGFWAIKGTTIEFTKQWIETVHANSGFFSYSKALTQEERELVYGKAGSAEYTCRPIRAIEGITREKTVYQKINIIFGVKDEHFDYSF